MNSLNMSGFSAVRIRQGSGVFHRRGVALNPRNFVNHAPKTKDARTSHTPPFARIPKPQLSFEALKDRDFQRSILNLELARALLPHLHARYYTSTKELYEKVLSGGYPNTNVQEMGRATNCILEVFFRKIEIPQDPQGLGDNFKDICNFLYQLPTLYDAINWLMDSPSVRSKHKSKLREIAQQLDGLAYEIKDFIYDALKKPSKGEYPLSPFTIDARSLGLRSWFKGSIIWIAALLEKAKRGALVAAPSITREPLLNVVFREVLVLYDEASAEDALRTQKRKAQIGEFLEFPQRPPPPPGLFHPFGFVETALKNRLPKSFFQRVPEILANILLYREYWHSQANEKRASDSRPPLAKGLPLAKAYLEEYLAEPRKHHQDDLKRVDQIQIPGFGELVIESYLLIGARSCMNWLSQNKFLDGTVLEKASEKGDHLRRRVRVFKFQYLVPSLKRDESVPVEPSGAPETIVRLRAEIQAYVQEVESLMQQATNPKKS